MDERHRSTELRNQGWALLLAAGLIPAFWPVFQLTHPEQYDPLWIRLTFSAVFGAWRLGMASSARVERATPTFFVLACLAVSTWSLWITQANGFGPDRVVGALVVQMVCGALLGSPRAQAAYHLTFAGVAAAGVATAPQIAIQPSLLLASIGTIAAFSFTTTLQRARLLAALSEREAQLQAARDELEARVDQRTVALLRSLTALERQIEERAAAEQAAARANLAKSQFLANMSHELRTPLNAILGYTELMREALADDRELARDLDRVHDAARHLRALIDDVLDLAKIESGRIELRLETVDVGRAVEDAVQSLRPLAVANRNQLLVQVPSPSPSIETDRTRLSQVLLNLVGNALKFTTDGTVRVVVAAEPGGGARIEVRDTGIGIAPADLERVFEKFVQVDPSSTRRHGGTGLGLAISRELCEMLGGTLAGTSAIGVGSTFRVTLPAQSRSYST